MVLSNIYDKIVLTSPRVEVFLRKFYWKYHSSLERFKPQRNSSANNERCSELTVNFDEIMNYLDSNIHNKKLLLIHSSYKSLKKTGLSAEQIIDKLLNYIGSNGTLVMPVIRTYEEEEIIKEEKNQDDMLENITCLYDVQKTKVHTGYLPICLMKHNGSKTSRFPLNTVTAFGPLAEEIVDDNLLYEGEAPNGIHSAWKHCLDNDATIVFLGADVTHSLTMIHTAEDAFDNWPIKNWYRKRRFKVIDGDFEKEIEVKERRPLWGKMFYLERTLKRDLQREDILHSTNIGGIDIGILSSQSLINYLNSRKQEAYPYCIPRKYFDK